MFSLGPVCVREIAAARARLSAVRLRRAGTAHAGYGPTRHFDPGGAGAAGIRDRRRGERRVRNRCAVGTPVWGRLMDRFGQVAVLLPTAVTSAALLVGLALATTNGAPDRALIAIAAGVGLSYPAISPALRSSFRIVLPDPQARRVAFALDATSVELAFVCGPLLLSALLLPRIPLLPLLVTAG